MVRTVTPKRSASASAVTPVRRPRRYSARAKRRSVRCIDENPDIPLTARGLKVPVVRPGEQGAPGRDDPLPTGSAGVEEDEPVSLTMDGWASVTAGARTVRSQVAQHALVGCPEPCGGRFARRRARASPAFRAAVRALPRDPPPAHEGTERSPVSRGPGSSRAGRARPRRPMSPGTSSRTCSCGASRHRYLRYFFGCSRRPSPPHGHLQSFGLRCRGHSPTAAK